MGLLIVKPSQRGAALIVGLILMVVMLVLALSSAQQSQLEERMAGNFRAGERALMAAEYGASLISTEVMNGSLEGSSLNDLMAGVELLVDDYVDSSGVSYFKVGEDDSAYFRVEVDASGFLETDTIKVVSIGEIFSGEPGEIGSEVVASREVFFELDVDVGYPSPVSLMCPDEFRMPSTPSGVDGEDPEIDSINKYRPAIAVGSLSKAAEITADILSASWDPSNPTPSLITGKNKNYQAVLVESDGAYHALQAAKDTDGDGEYDTVDYPDDPKDCKISTNPMCAIKGGVSEVTGAPPLSSAYETYSFIEAIFSADPLGVDSLDPDDDIVYHNASNFSPADIESGKVNIITSGRYHVLTGGEVAGVPEELRGVPLLFSDLDGDLSFTLEGGVTNGSYSAPLTASNLYSFGRFDKYVAADEWSSSPHFDVVHYSSVYFPNEISVLDVPDVYYSSYNFADGELSGLSVEHYREDLGDGSYGALLESYQDDFSLSGRQVEVDFGNSFSTDALDSEGNPQSTVILVDGDLKIGTRPQVYGLIIVLGDYLGYGGGNKDNSFVRGAVVVAPHYFGDDGAGYEFNCQPSVYDISGAGNFKVYFDRGRLKRAISLLPAEAFERWVGAGVITGLVTSWKESLGGG